MKIMIELKLQRLRAGAVEPVYATADSAGMDLSACLDAPLTLQPMERRLVPTGWAIALERGYEAQIRPRSGMAFKHGITVVNAPGTIDADYRGEVMVALINLSLEPFVIEDKMRIAQMVIAPVTQARLVSCDSLEETARGAGGFGSTGMK